MTAETLKPFLAAASAPNASRGQKTIVVSMPNTAGSADGTHDHDHEYAPASADGRRSPVRAARKNAQLFSFCAIVSICVLVLIGAEIWSSMRTAKLQRDVQLLDAQLTGLMRLLGLDNGINVEELNDMIRNTDRTQPIPQVTDEELNEDMLYDYGDFDEDMDSDDKETDRLLQTFASEDYNASGDDDIDDEDDDVDENDDDDSGDGVDVESSKIDASPMYLDAEERNAKRITRSLTEDLHFGTIVDTSNTNEVSQHIIPHQEITAEEPHPQRPKSRRSRVIASLLHEHRMAAKKTLSKKQQFAQAERMKKHKGSTKKSARLMQRSLSTRNTRRSHPIAVHYVGHTDHYETNNNHHYAGNGRLKHHGGVYADWKSANWSNTLNVDRFFSMQHGVVTVAESGLYHVYAQIYYYDAADESSFWVDHNERHLLQCATTVISSGTVPNASTCYTAGMVYLQSGDRIRVNDVQRHYALLKPERSFFGLVRIGSGGGGGRGGSSSSGSTEDML